MKSSIRKCPKCGRYSLEMRCQDCDVDTITSHPAKYSPDDKYGKYRRISIMLKKKVVNGIKSVMNTTRN